MYECPETPHAVSAITGPYHGHSYPAYAATITHEGRGREFTARVHYGTITVRRGFKQLDVARAYVDAHIAAASAAGPAPLFSTTS